MKKTVRIIGLCALVLLAAVSCKKNEGGITKTFRATLNSPNCDAKTYLGSDDYLYWNSGDAIKVFAADFTSAVFTTNDNGVTVANFNGNIAQSESYYAVYPASRVSDAENGRIVISIPSTQQFVPNGIANNSYYLAARNDGTPSFDFSGLFGLLAIPMKGNATIGSIELTDAMFNLWGEGTSSIDGAKGWGDFMMEGSDSRSDLQTLTLDFGAEGYTLSQEPVTAYFVLRPLACAYGFTVVVKDLNGGTLWTKTVPQNLDNCIKPERILLMPAITVNTEP